MSEMRETRVLIVPACETSLSAINIGFTDDGVKKMHDLTAAQLKKQIALVLDDKVIWVPLVTSVFPLVTSVQYVGTTIKDGVLTGNTGHGLTQEEVDRIIAILREQGTEVLPLLAPRK